MALNKLFVTRLRSLKDGMHNDGGGLYLRVRGDARSWVFRFRQGGKLHDRGLGSLNAVPLSKARLRAEECRQKLAEGWVPFATPPAKPAPPPEKHKLCDIYKDAMHYHVELRRLRGAGAEASSVSLLRRYVIPTLGEMAVEEITCKDVAATLKPLWDPHPQIAMTTLCALRACFNYAAANEWMRAPFPTDWKGVLNTLLPPLRRGQKHHACLPWEEIGGAYQRMAATTWGHPVVQELLLATLLWATRFGELGRMLAEDIDTCKRVLYVRHRKDGKMEPFVVPYPHQLDELMACAAQRPGMAFPAVKEGESITPSQARRFLAVAEVNSTVHGFRATFSTWCADKEKDPVLREMCLCHSVESTVALAYQRSDRLEPRRRLLQEWADFVTGCSPS